MAIPRLQEIQRITRTPTNVDDVGLMGGMGMRAGGAPSSPIPAPAPTIPPMLAEDKSKTVLGEPLKKVGLLYLKDLSEKVISDETKFQADKQQELVDAALVKKEQAESGGLPVSSLPQELYGALTNPVAASKSGGLIGMAAGGFMGQVPGEGHGMEDNVYMPIVERKYGDQVGTLAVSPDEYVVDAHTMSALGNGSADAGAKVMDRVVENVREKAFGTTQQPNKINGLAALRPMIERV